MNNTAEQMPDITPFARRLHQLDPGLSGEISGLRDLEDGEMVTWLDGRSAGVGRLNEAGRKIFQAYGESTGELPEGQLDRLTGSVLSILSHPVNHELANLQDRAIITEATGDPEEGTALRNEVRVLEFSLDMARRNMEEGLRGRSEEKLATGLGFMQHIRTRAGRQARGLTAYPEGEEE